MRILRPTLDILALAFGLGGLALLWCGLVAGPVNAQQGTDPVENLRLLLKNRLLDDADQRALGYRKDKLIEAAKALSLGDLRPALALSEWTFYDFMPNLTAVDQGARKAIGDRLDAIIKNAVDKGNATNQIAAARVVGEMGTTIRSLDPNEKGGYARSLAPHLAAMIEKSNDPAVRQAAALALGKINPEPKLAVGALEKLLVGDKQVGDRRAGSEALGELVSSVFQLQKKGRAQSGVDASKEDVMNCASAVVPAAGICLKDSDAMVRRNGLEALGRVGTALAELVPDPEKAEDMPPPDRPWSEAEKAKVKELLADLEKERVLFAPVIDGLKAQGKNLAAILSDPDRGVSVKSRRALDLMASARLRLLRREASIPTKEMDVVTSNPIHPLSEALKPSLLEIGKRVSDPDIEVRRATVDFLETLEEAAAPALDAVITALGDSDRFIRWAAARTLGKVGLPKDNPGQKDKAVLAIAKLLNPEEDADVREVAAYTIRNFGADAKRALPALIGMLNVGEAESQEAVIKAIMSVGGGSETKGATKGLVMSLDSRSPTVRRLAAEALGRMGADAISATADLIAHQDDDDPAVRQAISEALLNITQAKE